MRTLAGAPMNSLVPQNRRGIAAKSNRGEWMKGCTALTKGGRSRKDKTGAKGKRSVRAPQLPDEIVWQILVLLPVKSLLRFKSVCKAWRAIISDPAFIRAQLRCSASKWELDPSFIMSPNSLDPDFSRHIRFYQWKQGASVAEDMYAEDSGREFSSVRNFAHCDGLVLALADTRLYLFNPATRDVFTLPHGGRNNVLTSGRDFCYCAGLGLDPRSGMYKVVQAFYRSDHSYYTNRVPDMGMEVFTVACYSGAWREIDDDPPYPVKRNQAGVSVNGFLFWHIDKRHFKQPPRGVVCLCLDDEEFSVTGLPDSLDPAFDDAFILDELNGELCLAAHTTAETMTIWTMLIEDGASLNSQWERRYTIQVSDLFSPMAILPSSSGIILFKGDTNTLYRYELATSELKTLCEMDRLRFQGRRARKWKNLLFFNVRPYTGSLVRTTKAPQPFIPPEEPETCPIAIRRAELLRAFRNGTLPGM